MAVPGVVRSAQASRSGDSPWARSNRETWSRSMPGPPARAANAADSSSWLSRRRPNRSVQRSAHARNAPSSPAPGRPTRTARPRRRRRPRRRPRRPRGARRRRPGPARPSAAGCRVVTSHDTNGAKKGRPSAPPARSSFRNSCSMTATSCGGSPGATEVTGSSTAGAGRCRSWRRETWRRPGRSVTAPLRADVGGHGTSAAC